MLDDPDLRNITEVTTGYFLTFELFDNDSWRAFRISGSALSVLSAGANLTLMQSFERNIERIKGVAFNAHKVEKGYVVLDSPSFE